jgi:hypothetical protein
MIGWRWSGPVLLAAFLAGCGTAPERSPVAGSGGADAPSARIAGDGPAAASGAPPATPAGERSELALLAPGAIPGAALPTLKSLIGRSEADLSQALGAPDFKRADGEAQIWQYRTPACILDAFLYRTRDGVRVRHMEARGLDVRRIEGDACLLNVLALRAAGRGPSSR